ncbi:MAG: MBL fold metallo-hydrolase [Planctomycetota bacterium]|nr:MAG: MBL fold metallo-hydrolase [Planctomycetota bacterium]
MRLSFFGAVGEVTGSCTLVETSRARVLVDFGMHQGGHNAEARNRRIPPLRAEELDAVVLTHAHIDHSGRLPVLIDEGYRGRIHATPATIELCDILLRDSAHIQQGDADRLNRRRKSSGRRPAEPLYTETEVGQIMQRFDASHYGKPTEVAPGIAITYHDAGHILGSAWVEMDIEDTDQDGKPITKKIVFSGDIGPYGAPLLRDPVAPPACDALILESTYGDRDHKSLEGTVDELSVILNNARTARGKVIIPSFAVGRTQQMIYFIGQLERAGKLPNPRVYIDSPMAIKATTLYRRHREVFDDECWDIINSGESCLDYPGIKFTRTPDESRSINALGGGVIVVSASGMCTGGRVLHHLRHGLPREETHVVIVGYQGDGSLGRRIVEGQNPIRVMGRMVDVNAHIHTLGGFSAHAGQSDLVKWATPALASKPRVILNHGEDRQRGILSKLLGEKFGVEAAMPRYRDVVEV